MTITAIIPSGGQSRLVTKIMYAGGQWMTSTDEVNTFKGWIMPGDYVHNGVPGAGEEGKAQVMAPRGGRPVKLRPSQHLALEKLRNCRNYV